MQNGRLTRYSYDKRPLNQSSKDLINLCKSRGLLILNGRLFEDSFEGKYTRMNFVDNPSVVDYVVANARMFDAVCDFKINSKFPESDHLPISFSIKCNYNISVVSDKKPCKNEFEQMTGITWHYSDLDRINSLFHDKVSLKYIEIYQQCITELKSVNQVGDALIDYIKQAIHRICPLKKCTSKSKNKRRPIWYDKECRILRSNAVNASQTATQLSARNNALSACKKYRAHKQMKIRKFKDNCQNALHNAFVSDKSSMWKVLEGINRY